ncbi:uncharacterized protein EV420DRAFT_1479702 [Desarmillaria tabescens]|uniref:Uncharacterized protein n=1 Tax=Armillaria tabescens TaxID=1929756 RepID=A0AA39KCF4_ARMTA|nr:uncharacterized protein EV420DRAFT_1479702 [Desarmillaria tabescens]KAK0458427.1 hypothetical protein EV420DRAFT_1479702 [Desarmillaria tabescens]
MVVNHYPPAQCAAYVQKTPLAQRCTCEVWLCDHVAINNWYRSAEPWNVMGDFPDTNSPSSNVNAISFSNDTITGPYTLSSMSVSSADSDNVTFSHDVNLGPITGTPIFSPSPRHSFSPSHDARNAPLTLAYISAPPVSSASSGILQSDIAHAQTYGSGDYFVQYPDHFINNSYVPQPEGGMADDNS